MPTARFFFDAGSGGVLWAVTPEGKEAWGYPVELDRLPISRDLRDGLRRLTDRYDTSLNWDYPPDPGPWREAECRNFNESVRQALGRLRTELGPAWQIDDEFDPLHEDRTSTATWPTQPDSFAPNRLLRGGVELAGYRAGAQFAQVRDVVVEGARGDAEQLGDRGD